MEPENKPASQDRGDFDAHHPSLDLYDFSFRQETGPNNSGLTGAIHDSESTGVLSGFQSTLKE